MSIYLIIEEKPQPDGSTHRRFVNVVKTQFPLTDLRLAHFSRSRIGREVCEPAIDGNLVAIAAELSILADSSDVVDLDSIERLGPYDRNGKPLKVGDQVVVFPTGPADQWEEYTGFVDGFRESDAGDHAAVCITVVDQNEDAFDVYGYGVELQEAPKAFLAICRAPESLGNWPDNHGWVTLEAASRRLADEQAPALVRKAFIQAEVNDARAEGRLTPISEDNYPPAEDFTLVALVELEKEDSVKFVYLQ